MLDLYFCSINITQCRNFSYKVWNVISDKNGVKIKLIFDNHSSSLNEQRIENGKINLSPISSLSITYLAEPFQYSSCGSGHWPPVSQNTQWSTLHGDHFLAPAEIKPLLLKFSSARGILRAYSEEFNEQ